ncbi:MAG: FecR domain-containing protein [Gammaproteobacteria bacterium]|nr:FecR domain-containing protein [Gammaproteobacteria bacterium]
MVRALLNIIPLIALAFFLCSGIVFAAEPVSSAPTPAVPALLAKPAPTSVGAPIAPPTTTTAATAPTSTTSVSAMIGQMVWVKGTVKAEATDQKERPLERQSPVYEGDTLKTGADGSGQVVFTDGSLLVLRSGTEFKIDQYHYDKKGKPADNHFIANFIKGAFRTITGLIAHTHYDSYSVKTPVATIGVRGTEYVASLTGNNLIAQTLRDPIVVTNDAGQIVLDPEKQAAAQISGLNIKPRVVTAPASLVQSLPAPTPAPAPTPSSSPSNNQNTGGAVGTTSGSDSSGGSSGPSSSGGSSSGSSSSSSSTGTSGTNTPTVGSSTSNSTSTTVDAGSGTAPSTNTNKIVNCIQLKAN